MAGKSLRHASLEPTHPGEMLDTIVLPAAGVSKTEVARLLHMSRQTLYSILKGEQPISTQTAVRLGKLFGNEPRFWLNMQTAYDVWHAEREIDTSDIRTLAYA